MRFRLLEPRDFSTCRSLLNPALRLSRRVIDELPTLWATLAEAGTCSIVEDPAKSFPECIEGFGASAFVDDAFVDQYLNEPRNYLDAALFERMLDGPSPVLSDAQIAEANAGGGLNLVVLNFGLRDHDLSDPTTQRVLPLGTAAFYTLHAGYNVKTILSEVFGAPAAAYMTAGGFRLQGTMSEKAATDTDTSSPRLFALRRDWIQPGAINTLSLLFHPRAPVMGFSRSEQRVLAHALLNLSDAEIAQRLGLSLDGVKKTWRRVFDRVAQRVPSLTADDRHSDAAGRRSEKRRHVLQYLRAHPEEVRPTRRR